VLITALAALDTLKRSVEDQDDKPVVIDVTKNKPTEK
jgi:hypothetical protein